MKKVLFRMMLLLAMTTAVVYSCKEKTEPEPTKPEPTKPEDKPEEEPETPASIYNFDYDATVTYPDGYTSKWADAANKSVDALIKYFWGASFAGHESDYYFYYEGNMSNQEKNHYWPQAHAMDVVVDAYLRTGKRTYKNVYPQWYKGAPANNWCAKPEDGWYNDYIDDMEWIVLALIRMYESMDDTDYLEEARRIYDTYIWKQWGPEDGPTHGGITWCLTADFSKNACSNGPAAIIAAKLAKYYPSFPKGSSKSRDEYVEEAIKIYQWEKKYLFNANSGLIADNMKANGQISGGATSYNQGTFIGAGLLLYRLTGDNSYLADIQLAADYAIANIGTRVNGVRRMVNPGTGDNGLFHGIFFRYFAQLTNEKAVSIDKRKEYANYIDACAQIAAASLVENVNIFSTNWATTKVNKTSDKSYLNPHVSGCTLMAAAAVIDPALLQ